MSIINSKEITVDTVTPSISIGEIMVSADRRNNKGIQLSDSERIRRVVIPAGHWGQLTATMNGTPAQGLTDILINGLKAIAAARLRDYLQEQPMARTVALADYSVSALLAWSEETASSRGSITFDRDDIIEWYPTSKLFAAMAARGKQFTDFMQQRLAALAAKNHGIKSPEDALKLQTLLADDADTSMGSELIQRLAHIEKSLNARKLETTLSIADL
jgi:hypothetical protein